MTSKQRLESWWHPRSNINAEVTGQPQESLKPTKSEQNIYEMMGMHMAGEEETELLKALALSLRDDQVN